MLDFLTTSWPGLLFLLAIVDFEASIIASVILVGTLYSDFFLPSLLSIAGASIRQSYWIWIGNHHELSAPYGVADSTIKSKSFVFLLRKSLTTLFPSDVSAEKSIEFGQLPFPFLTLLSTAILSRLVWTVGWIFFLGKIFTFVLTYNNLLIQARLALPALLILSITAGTLIRVTVSRTKARLK